MGIDAILREDIFFEKYPLISHNPRDLIYNDGIVRQYQGYISANVIFKAYKNESVSIDSEVLIMIPYGYPVDLPQVFLLKRGEPVNYGLDYHFYPCSGQLCLGLSWEIREKLYKDASLLNLMDNIIIPHIAGTQFTMKHPESRYPQGEYSHGLDGIIEGLISFFRIPKDLKLLVRIINFLDLNNKAAERTICPFGCGKKYRNCQCRGDINDLKALFPKKERQNLKLLIYKNFPLNCI